MKVDSASKTAQYMALFRAIESARPVNKRLFYDPFANLFLDKGLKIAAKLSAYPVLGPIIKNYIWRKGPGSLSSGISRTKYIDDLLETAIHAGVDQVIILGAGYDTRALRLPFLKKTKVIEIDHPNTSKYKIALLKSARAMNANVSYHQIDFDVQKLEDVIGTTGLDINSPAAVIWEGVTNYLTSAAIDATFTFLSRLAAGSYVIFTYIDRLVLESPRSYAGAETVMKHLNELQENWRFGFAPSELRQYLAKFRYTLIEDNGADSYRKKYMPGFSEEGYGFYRVAFARRQ